MSKYTFKISFGKDIIEKLLEDIKNVIGNVLEEFGQEVAQELAERASVEVYGVYDPEYYRRRYTLEDPSNYSVEVDKENMKVSITPVASFNRLYGGWNEGDELGGFMNFGRYWHGYVMSNGWDLPSGGPWNVPLPRPYLSNYAESGATWDKLYNMLKSALGDLIEYVDFNIGMGYME